MWVHDAAVNLIRKWAKKNKEAEKGKNKNKVNNWSGIYGQDKNKTMWAKSIKLDRKMEKNCRKEEYLNWKLFYLKIYNFSI